MPDVVLPFKLSKPDAKSMIEAFVNKRRFFAHPKFVEEFSAENVMGVYFPYMVVDMNSHASFSGRGEHQVRRYTRGSGSNQRTYYDADLYDVDREFDLSIKGLTVESSADKLNKKDSHKTNNVINAIMPFDIENSVKWDSNYLKGYTSERRDTNVEQLKPLVDTQAKDVARFSANKTLELYDRGVRWDSEHLDIKGRQWKTAYLPVWLYSYQEKKGENDSLLHYVAINARTKETMGSVPIHMPKLIGASAIVEFIGLLLMLFVDFDYSFLFLLLGFIFFFFYYAKYRNFTERHHHETETPTEMFNVVKSDKLIKRETGLSNSKIEGANNKKVSGQGLAENLLNNVSDINPFKNFK